LAALYNSRESQSLQSLISSVQFISRSDGRNRSGLLQKPIGDREWVYGLDQYFHCWVEFQRLWECTPLIPEELEDEEVLVSRQYPTIQSTSQPSKTSVSDQSAWNLVELQASPI
jgi:hypothetical protein